MKKTIAYIDGFNLYMGLMDERYTIFGDNSEYPLRKYLWLKLDDFLSSYLPSDFELSQIKYFTAPVKGDESKYARQELYLNALSTIDNLTIYLGKHIQGGRKFSEKQTDVKMALHMYRDALDGNCQSMILLSGDSDQVPTIQWIKSLNTDIDIHIVFPPFRVSHDLRELADYHHKIKWKRLRKFQFPDPIISGDTVIYKPSEWS